MLGAAIGGIERPGKAAEPLQGEEPMQGDKLGLDSDDAGKLVAQTNGSIEHGAVPHVDLDAIAALAEQDLFDPVAVEDGDRLGEAADVECVRVAGRRRVRDDRQDEGIDVGTPEDRVTCRRAACGCNESEAPKA